MRTRRIALLPTPGDPFLLTYWLWLFNKTWRQDIDELLILFNSPIEDYAFKFIENQVQGDPKIRLFHVKHQTEHGDGLVYLIRNGTSPGDHVMLVEDDAFIFKPGMVDLCFKLIESGQTDMVGSRRGSCSQEIVDAAVDKKWITMEGEGDLGPAFWPNFFFINVDNLLKTDMNFNARGWEPGERIDCLDLTFKEKAAGDTFVWTSLQLQGMNLRFYPVKQYHGHPDDIDHYNAKTNLWDGICPWFHVGSLSSGINGILTDEYGRPLTRIHIDEPKLGWKLPNYVTTDFERREWERRISFWLLFRDFVKFKYSLNSKMTDLLSRYSLAIDRLIARYELIEYRIGKRILVYQELINQPWNT